MHPSKNIMRRLRTLLLSLLITLVPALSYAMSSGFHLVRDVIDGDTIVLQNGELVRYIGIDTPEINEPYYHEAKMRNTVLVMGKMVRVNVCPSDPRDKYGRVLAWVYYGETFINEQLLREGMAKVLIIPPCGLPKAREFEAAELEARKKRIGIWGAVAGPRMIQTIRPEEALLYLGREVTVSGTVDTVRPGEKAWFLEFRGGFQAVIPRRFQNEFTQAGKDPQSFAGRTVTVTGVVTEHRGRPEMILDIPSRIE